MLAPANLLVTPRTRRNGNRQVVQHVMHARHIQHVVIRLTRLLPHRARNLSMKRPHEFHRRDMRVVLLVLRSRLEPTPH